MTRWPSRRLIWRSAGSQSTATVRVSLRTLVSGLNRRLGPNMGMIVFTTSWPADFCSPTDLKRAFLADLQASDVQFVHLETDSQVARVGDPQDRCRVLRGHRIAGMAIDFKDGPRAGGRTSL